MNIKNALAINSEGLFIESFSENIDVKEFMLIDLNCLKELFTNILSIKNNSFLFLLKVIFKSTYCRSTSSLASFINLSIFDVYKSLEEISQRSDFEIDPKNLNIILLLTILK
jgi:hypothetical protein